MKLTKNLKYIIVLSLISFIAYLPSFGNQFVWDDEQFIYNNEYVKTANFKKIFTTNTIEGAGETSSYYRPLTTASFAVDNAIWGLKPFGFHLTNTTLHTLAGILLFLYLINIGIKQKNSFWISAIFLTHPIQTEAVVYANSRGDSMYIFWAMLGLLTYSLLLKKHYPKLQIYDLSIQLKKKSLSILIILFYLLSILGKEIGIASLGLFFLTFIIFNYKDLLSQKKNKIVKLFKNNINHLVVLGSLFTTAMTYLFFRSKVIHIASNLSNLRAGTPYGDSLYVRLHTFTKAIWEYFYLLLAPYPLHMERNLEVLTQLISIWLVSTIILFILISIIGYIEFKKKKTIFIWFGSLWFFSMLVTVSGIIPINGLIYEHWLYMPIIGAMISIYGLIGLIFEHRLDKFLKYFLPVLVTIYILMTIRQNYIWGTPTRFYNHTLKFANTARLHNNLAMAYATNNKYQEAVESYKKAIEVSDYYPQTHYNLGNTYAQLQDFEMAKKEYIIAIKMNENFIPSYPSLINIFILEEDFENAESLVSRLLKNDPTNEQLLVLKIKLLYELSMDKEAENTAQEFLLVQKYSPEATEFVEQLKQEYSATQN